MEKKTMNGNTKKRLKREALDNIMKEHPSLNEFLNTLVENEKPEIYEVVKASITEAIEKARMSGVKMGYIAALLWTKNKIEKIGLDKTMEELDNKIQNLTATMGIKSFYDVDNEDKDTE